MEAVRSSENGGASEAPYPYDEVEVEVSDLHFGAGAMLRVRATGWRKKVHRAKLWLQRKDPGPEVIEVPNPLEDFHADDEFAAFLDLVGETYAQAEHLNFHLMGDIWDPLAITWRGRSDDPDYEVVAAYKVRQCIRGHRKPFDALARLVRRPNARLFIYTGNHDQATDWPLVQELILRRLCGKDPELRARVEFIDRTRSYERLHRGIHWYHGQDAESHNTIDPKTSIITERFGVQLKRPRLNKPLGSDMTVRLVNRIKLYNAHVGRLRQEKHVWKYASRFRWLWALWAGVALLWYLFTQQASVFFDFRDKAGLLGLLRLMFGKLRDTLRVVRSTSEDNPVDAHAKRWLRENGHKARIVVRGHSHGPCRETDADGTYLNSGTWVTKVKLIYPKLELTWGAMRWVELAWRSWLLFFSTGKLSFARQLTKFVGFLAAVVPVLVFLFLNYKDGEKLLTFEANSLKIPAAIFVVLSIVLGIIKMLSVRPEAVDDTRYTFILVRHGIDGSVTGDLKEYIPKENVWRDYV